MATATAFERRQPASLAMTFIKSHPLLTYVALVFTISWGGSFLILGPGGLPLRAEEFESLGAWLYVAIFAGPSVAGILLTGVVDGRPGFREVSTRLRRWRAGWHWYALALLPALVMTVTPLLLSIVSADFSPAILDASDKTRILMRALGPALIAGVFEEIGWTGFAVPHLRSRYSIAWTGLAVGVIWGAWHFPLFWQRDSFSATLPFVILLTALFSWLPALRVLLVWIHDRTESLPVVMFMHAAVSFISIIFASQALTGTRHLASVLALAGAMWLLVGAVRLVDGRLRFSHTKPFRGPDGNILVNSVAEAKYLRLGGVDQWVMIRGQNIDNPPLIVLHGGPGMSEMGFFRHGNAALERYFTVVHWDQRGTGKSFDRDIPRCSMTLEQFVADLDELVDVVRRRFVKEKVAILGHSWGSALGAIYAARFPAKVSVYAGVAQIGDWAAAESLSYSYGVTEAERQRDKKALKKLRSIGPAPYSAKSVFIERTVVHQLDGQMRLGIAWKAGRALFGRPESSILDLPNLVRGFRFTLDAMWADVSALNLLTRVPALKMPVVIFVGRRDHWVPPDTSVAFFDSLATPSKKLVWFEQSGHEAFVDEPGKFNAMMVELVHPVAASATSESQPRTKVARVSARSRAGSGGVKWIHRQC
jgi:pimeloyl-ACP methyl ester carboxylesterase/membrane protease YdiL (CAAX protease family)